MVEGMFLFVFYDRFYLLIQLAMNLSNSEVYRGFYSQMIKQVTTGAKSSCCVIVFLLSIRFGL